MATLVIALFAALILVPALAAWLGHKSGILTPGTSAWNLILFPFRRPASHLRSHNKKTDAA
jgi:hypothetical protein